MTNTTSPASALETAVPGIPLFSIREQILIQISDAAEGQGGADIRLAVAAGLGLAVAILDEQAESEEIAAAMQIGNWHGGRLQLADASPEVPQS